MKCVAKNSYQFTNIAIPNHTRHKFMLFRTFFQIVMINEWLFPPHCLQQPDVTESSRASAMNPKPCIPVSCGFVKPDPKYVLQGSDDGGFHTVWFENPSSRRITRQKVARGTEVSFRRSLWFVF